VLKFQAVSQKMANNLGGYFSAPCFFLCYRLMLQTNFETVAIVWMY